MTRSDKACRAIRAATKESEVIGAVRDYLESLDASDAGRLPAEILVMGLTPAEELVQTALQVLHSGMEQAQEDSKGDILNEATLVFTTAARRLATLAKDAA
jgi:hypothetical protein